MRVQSASEMCDASPSGQRVGQFPGCDHTLVSESGGHNYGPWKLCRDHSFPFLIHDLCFREYYLLIYAYEDYQELLVTAIVDTPPEFDNQVNVGPGFTIQRMGRPN